MKRRPFSKEITHHYGPIAPPQLQQPPNLRQSQGRPALGQGQVEYRRQASGATGTVQSDVWIIVLWAIITGMMVAITLSFLAAVACGYFGRPWWPLAVLVGIGIGLVSMLAVMLTGMSDRRRLWWQVEKMVGQDLDGDGITGPPPRKEEPAMTLNIEYQEGAKFRLKRLELPQGTNLDAFYQLAVAALNGLPVSERAWTPLAKRGFSSEKFRLLMRSMENAGVLSKENPGVDNSPRHLTGYGRSVLKEFVETYPLHRARKPRV